MLVKTLEHHGIISKGEPAIFGLNLDQEQSRWLDVAINVAWFNMNKGKKNIEENDNTVVVVEKEEKGTGSPWFWAS